MKTNFVTLLFLILISFVSNTHSLKAQTSERLEGDIIGSEAYAAHQSLEKAFDNNPQTWFKAKSASGGWVGLDLGKPHVITKIEFQSHDTNQNTLALFEGANSADFIDALPLYMIKRKLNSRDVQSVDVDISKGFRYIRYIGPANQHSRIAELAFYGYESAGDDQQLFQLTNIPTVVIHTKDAEDIVEKEKYLDGEIKIISENGLEFFTEKTEIRGRGNASWSFPKKPYKLKLNKKASLLGMPANEKVWTLINNYGDKTLMRNLLAFELSENLELSFSPAGVAVDVILNGEYKGTYQLCDQVEVATNRVETDKIKADDIAEPNVTGGYLIEIDAYAYDETSWFESAKNKTPVTIKFPKEDKIVLEQHNYIKSHFDKLEAALFSANYTDNDEGFRKYLHTPSFIRHFLVGEISGNADTYWSTYMYKKRGDELFYTGPVWDFDLAFENDSRTYPINEKGMDWVFNKNGSYAKGMRDFVNRLLSDETFYNELKQTYFDYRESGVLSEEAMVEMVDRWENEIYESQKLNFTRWDILGSKVHLNPQALGSYEAEVNVVRNYLRNRIRWIDEKLGYVKGGVEDDFLLKPKYTVANGQLNIEGLPLHSVVTIIDVAGRVISQKTLSDSNHYSLRLNKGVYIVKIQRNYFSVESSVEKLIVH